jgi:predicted RNA binding protein YcfA (HicA-like mRNA interferase family)
MNRKKLEKIQREVDKFRRSSIKAADVERLARQLGRKRAKHKGGSEPMWENHEFPDLRALSIPHHSNKDFKPGTKNSILDQLEEDILSWEERLELEERHGRPT